MFNQEEIEELLFLVKSVPLDEPQMMELVQKYVEKLSNLKL